MPEQRLGIAMIGLGMVASTHVQALQALDTQLVIRGAYARDATRREAFGARFGVAVADDAKALIERGDVDIVLLLTPPDARQAYVQIACAAGKHVLLEKPIERSHAAARDIVEACAAAGVKLGVTFQHRFRDAAQTLKSLIDSGALGRLAAGRIAIPWWREQAYYDVPGRGTYARDGGGVLISQAIHTLDLMLWLLGMPETVMAMATTTSLHRMEAEDLVAGALRWTHGAIVSLAASTAAYPGSSEYMALDFEHASVYLSGDRLDIYHQDGRRQSHGAPSGGGGGADPMAFTHAWHRRAIGDFAQAVRGDHEPTVSGRSALDVHVLIDALLASSQEGRVIGVASSPAHAPL